MKITVDELFDRIVKRHPQLDQLPLQKVMMEECCETALNSNPELADLDVLENAVQIAFITCNSTLKATLKGLLESSDADKINLNYRNQKFTFTSDSHFLQDD
ncbi:hypothetical protein [Crocinitomix algicola]|uniref:hypothetical protein n=1 Tax=Crocinitomix algicola TaxID=1740263 RepID=UPI00083212F0|nr:hypothetical protein [Crocinitomix algicola]